MDIINVDGFQCFYGIISTILNKENKINNNLILNCYMWNYGFTYDFYDLQNNIVYEIKNCVKDDFIVQTQIEDKYGVKLKIISSNNIKFVDSNLEYGKPIFVRNQKNEVYVIVDFIRDKYALKNKDGVVFFTKSQLAECSIWEINEMKQQCKRKLNCELRITDHRYSLIRAAREQFGLRLEYVSSIEDLYKYLQSGKSIIAQCNIGKLPYKGQKQSKIPRYVLIEGMENHNVQLIDVVDKKEIRIDFSYLIDEVLDIEKIMCVCLWEELKKDKTKSTFIQESWIKLFVQDNAEEICKNTDIFYEQLYYYIEDNILNNSEQLQKKLDNVYCQFGDIEKVRALFIDAIKIGYTSHGEKIQELYETIKENWHLLKILLVRVMFFKNEIILAKLYKFMEDTVKNEKKLISMLKNDWRTDLNLSKKCERKLDGFEIFKDLWYRNCVYHGIFTAMSYYNKPIFPFLSQNIYLYDENSNNGLIRMKKPINEDMGKVLSSMGISLSYNSVKTNIIKDVVYNIDHNRIIIVPVDKYYEEICPDTYKKVHQRHDIMIYGYNFQEQKVYVIENKYINSYVFEKLCMSFVSLYQAHQGYRSNYYDEVKKDYLCLDNISDFIGNLNEAKEKYKNNAKRLWGDKKKSLQYIYKLIETLCLENQQIDSSQWIDMCNDIITNKKIEAFSCKKLEIDCNYELKEDIIKNWDLIRINLIKLERTKERENILDNIQKYLQNIIILENSEISDCSYR